MHAPNRCVSSRRDGLPLQLLPTVMVQPKPLSTRRSTVATAGKRVIALDFDGVVCDSVGESCLSAIKVCDHEFMIHENTQAQSKQDATWHDMASKFSWCVVPSIL